MAGNNGRLAAGSRRSPVSTADGRGSREQADADRKEDGLALSQDERERLLRDDALQNQLPTPPHRPGVHWFWASMTNTYTTVAWYKRLGYRPVKFEELEGWADANMRGVSGDYSGCVTVNEMLLMQTDEPGYQRFMKVIHHDKPLEEQHGLRGRVDETREVVAAEANHDGLVTDGAGPGEASGFKALERSAKRPRKFD